MSGPTTIFFRLQEGIRIQVFPGFYPGILLSFSGRWIRFFFSVWIQVWPFGFSDTDCKRAGSSWIWIRGSSDQDLSVLKDLGSGFLRIWILGSSGSLDVGFRILRGSSQSVLDCSRLLIQRCKTLLKK